MDASQRVVVVTALVFDVTNGFHDTANAMATSLSTTQVCTGAVLGAGAGRRPAPVRWGRPAGWRSRGR